MHNFDFCITRIERAVKDVETIKSIRKIDRKYQEILELKTKRRIDLVKGKLDHDYYNLEYGFKNNPSGNVTVRECISCLGNDGYLIEEIDENTIIQFVYYILDLLDVISDNIKEKYMNIIPVDKKTYLSIKEYNRYMEYLKSEYNRFENLLDDKGYIELINWHSRLKTMGEL